MNGTLPRGDLHSGLLRFFDTLPGGSDSSLEIACDTQLLASGVLDSLNLFMLVSYIEDEMGIAVDPEDITPKNFATLDSIGAMLLGYLDKIE